MKILIIEDEISLADEIEQFLIKEHYQCDKAYTGSEASELLAVNPYDFVLLDIGLPDYYGLDLIKEAKTNNSDAYFIVITAKGELQDKLKGFNYGADDYLPKPFSLLELQSRIQAITRRKFGQTKAEIHFGKFTIDINKRLLKFNDLNLDLTKKEFDILSYLVLNKGRTLDRMQLTEHLWGGFYEEDYDSNYIDVHIKNIRRKLLQFDDQNWIKTIRGLGYKFDL